MVAKRIAETPHSASVRKQRARADLATALLAATGECGLSQEGAARAIGVAKRTIGRWVHCEVEMNVEAVLAAPTRLARAFRTALCVHTHESVSYVARKRSGARK